MSDRFANLRPSEIARVVLGIGPRNTEHAAKCEQRKAHLAEVQANG